MTSGNGCCSSWKPDTVALSATGQGGAAPCSVCAGETALSRLSILSAILQSQGVELTIFRFPTMYTRRSGRAWFTDDGLLYAAYRLCPSSSLFKWRCSRTASAGQPRQQLPRDHHRQQADDQPYADGGGLVGFAARPVGVEQRRQGRVVGALQQQRGRELAQAVGEDPDPDRGE